MQNRSIALIGVALACVAFAFVACSDTQTLPTPPDSVQPSFAKGGVKVRSISLSPATATVEQGATLQLTATANPANSASTFDWSSTNPAVATVSSTGLVTGLAAGTASIRASAGGKTGTASITVPVPPPAPGEEILVGAGDIASCMSSGDEATANVLDGITGTVFTLGDNAYDIGSSTNYTNCYEPTWGRHKARTKPAPGNHEYGTSGASGYFNYFGSAAGTPGLGYYSYNLGAWHIIVLNSNTNCTTISCAADSTQGQWLKADLQANSKLCTLAYWHHPRFNSGAGHGNSTAVAPFWELLYQYGADVVLNGHEHVYERFAPQRPNATADPTNGIRQFTVGTGGKEHYSFKPTVEPNSEARNATANGVLKLTLRSNSYAWEFVAAAGSSFTDSGTGLCH